MTTLKKSDSKKGKQDETLSAHKPERNPNPMFQAHKLQGFVRNTGIKNIGKQQKKGKRGDR